jgi:predicted kinase
MMRTPIVNRDAIRKTIGGSIRYYKEEDRVTEIERIMAESLFNAGHNDVIIDACHLKPKYRNAWTDWASLRDIEVHFYYVMTALDTCIMRAKRNFPDEPKFPAIIRTMWEKSDIGDAYKIPEYQKDNWS